MEEKNTRKYYVQTSSATTMREVLKIKETFSNLQTKKNKKIQKIINDKDKPKLKFNMMIKSLSRKQIIVSMSNENKTIHGRI